MIDMVPRGTISEAPAVPVTDETLGNTSLVRGPGAFVSLLGPETPSNGHHAERPYQKDNPSGSPVLFSSAGRITPVSPLVPICDLPSYLAERDRECIRFAHFTQEESLWVKVPDETKQVIRALLGATPGGGKFGYVQSLVRGNGKKDSGLSVTKAVQVALHDNVPRCLRSMPLNTFRSKFDLWAEAKDWLVLVNRAKAGPAWQKQTEAGLPDKFVQYVASVIGKFKRKDAQRQAILSVHRHWTKGRDNRGEEFAIPGYESGWQSRNTEILPDGWSESNIRRQIKERKKLTEAVHAILIQGTAAAAPHLPQVNSTRNVVMDDGSVRSLRFMEQIQFDDVKTDWRVMVDGVVCDLWLLVARDLATGMLLGFGLRPARVREDGSQEHLKLQDMKQLLGWLFEHYGLPPYTCHHKYERGTASISKGTAAAIVELFGNLPSGDGQTGSVPRVLPHFSSMLGGTAPSGYAERKVGNARGKASLESHNRLMHTIGADLPAQTGPHYGKRPADLIAREKEAVEIWNLGSALPEHVRGKLEFPILTLAQARAELRRIFTIQNNRTVHEMEGFEDVVEVYDESIGRYIPQHQVKPTSRISSTVPPRPRKESPCERAARLRAPYAHEWTGVSPDIITTFYAHTQHPVKVDANGEIELKRVSFVPAPNTQLPRKLTGLVGYLNPDQPGHLYVTDGKGSLIGIWLRKNLVSNEEELQAAIKYSAAALSEAKRQADELNASERQRLEAMRENNSRLLAEHTFVDIAPATLNHHASTLKSPVATALATIPRVRKQRQDSHDADQALADSIDDI